MNAHGGPATGGSDPEDISGEPTENTSDNTAGNTSLTSASTPPANPDSTADPASTSAEDIAAEGPANPADRIRAPLLRRHPALTAAGALIVLVALVVGGCFAVVRLSVRSDEYTAADVPSRPVALVFGAGLRPDGTPSDYLVQRLNTALALYRSGKVRALLVSGDNAAASHDEPSAMRTWLLARGVPDIKIVRDYAGFDTWASCDRAREVFGVTAAVLVTQDFHLPRALFLCRGVGIDAVGVAAPMTDAREFAYTVREMPAAVEAVWDDVFKPDPHFLGPPDDGVEKALAAG